MSVSNTIFAAVRDIAPPARHSWHGAAPRSNAALPFRRRAPAAPQTRQSAPHPEVIRPLSLAVRNCGGPCRYSASETYCDRSCASILAFVRQVPVAHRIHGRLRIFRVSEVSLHLGPNVEPLGIGNIQVDVVSAGIHRRQHGEQRLACLQRDRIIVVRQTNRRQQP